MSAPRSMSEWDYMAKVGLTVALVTLHDVGPDDALAAIADYLDESLDAIAARRVDVDALRAARDALSGMITDLAGCDDCGADAGVTCGPDCLGGVA